MKITRRKLRKIISETLDAGDAKFNRFRANEIINAYDEAFHGNDMGLYLYQNVRGRNQDDIDSFVRDVAIKAYNYVSDRVDGNPFRGLDSDQGIDAVYNSLSGTVYRFMKRMGKQ